LILDRFSLKGKVAVVTGGAGLYGRQIVRALGEAGAHTVVAARSRENLDAAVAAFSAEGLPVSAETFDQGDETSVNALRDAVLAKQGRVDILVNNAVLRTMKKGMQDDADTFQESMRVNATGLFTISRAFGDAMADRGDGGSIINIGSIQGMIGPDEWIYEGTEMNGWYPDYFFHKGGMINFTRYIAAYYGRFGIRCNCLSPGGFETASMPARFQKQYSRRTFLGRLANESDLMGAVVFLASNASVYLTGTNIPVDGGYTAK
jgi:NAD(P)-dependent dehydrogenase (short-subunit alcohol dehydrogenase family)